MYVDGNNAAPVARHRDRQFWATTILAPCSGIRPADRKSQRDPQSDQPPEAASPVPFRSATHEMFQDRSRRVPSVAANCIFLLPNRKEFGWADLASEHNEPARQIFLPIRPVPRR